jgi:hypothetical protein
MKPPVASSLANCGKTCAWISERVVGVFDEPDDLHAVRVTGLYRP